jgi:hypothetical protein
MDMDMDRTVVIMQHGFMHVDRSATTHTDTSLLMLKLVQSTVCEYYWSA